MLAPDLYTRALDIQERYHDHNFSDHKRDKTKRFYIDYRKLNDIVSPDVTPSPLIETVPDRLSNAKIFFIANISNAFREVPIHPEY
ncbi:K02A2.6-like [Cordylochernes scorpioides]|uniref:K02A2.6-like n=1 Tax=Cordylochernes scorpioides TaxID=51811 RepID=A0ABY6K0L3_9ARAC|nr:K02A2.6-like [Cordylochernes scorpioides]